MVTSLDPRDQVAVFIDFENLALALQATPDSFDVWRVIHYASEYGVVGLKRAYADWRSYNPFEYKLVSNNLDLVQVYSRGVKSKNGADIRLAVDAMEILYTRPHFSRFVIVASDSDYTGLILKLREYGKYVVGIGSRGTHSEHLKNACNEFVYYSRILGGEAARRLAESLSLDDVRPAVIDVLRNTPPEGLPLPLFRPAMLRIDPAFSERDYGFESIHAFTDALGDLLERHIDPLTGTPFIRLSPAALRIMAEESRGTLEAVPMMVDEQQAKDPEFWARLLKERYHIQMVPRPLLLKLLHFVWYAYKSDRYGNPSKFKLEELLVSNDESLADFRDVELEDLRRVDQLLYTSRAFFFPGRDQARPAPRMSDPRTLNLRFTTVDDLLKEVNVTILGRLITEHLTRNLKWDEELLKRFVYAPRDEGFTSEAWRDLLNEALSRSRQHLAKTGNAVPMPQGSSSIMPVAQGSSSRLPAIVQD